MKKLSSLLLVLAFGLTTSMAMACPKGEVLTGGTGPHHKGGTCAPKAAKKAAAAKEMPAPAAKDAAKK